MGLFSGNENNPKEKKHSGILGMFANDVIKWEPEKGSELDVIVHKFEYEDFPNGSQLIVGHSQMAFFVNNMEAGSSGVAGGSGQAQASVFIGPCKIKLDTGNPRFSLFRNFNNALTGGDSAFHCTVYFINTTYLNDLNWGTQSPIVIMDPVEEVNIHVRAQGLFGVHIEQADEALAVVQAMKVLKKIVGTKADFSKNDLIAFMRAKILDYVPTLLATRMIDKNVGILTISKYLKEFSNIIKDDLVEHFNDFGLTLDNFSFNNINAPDEDLQAINEMKIAKKRAQLEAEGTANKMDIESAARARQREREGYTYQQERSFDVMSDAAQNEGMSSNFMGAGMGLGMGLGVGGAMGAGFSNVAQNSIGSINAQATPDTNADTIECPTCKAKLSPNAKFCASCGNKVSQAKSCSNCGAALSENAKFCIECGQKVLTDCFCENCGAKNKAGAKFCMECGNKL